MSDEERRPPVDRSAPEGAGCVAHPERPAFATCPRCSEHACLVCWHVTLDRCHRCLMKYPEEVSSPPRWEREGNALARFFGTLRESFVPSRAALTFALGGGRAPIWFFLFSFLPLALIEGVVPYTHTLQFGERMVRVIGHPTQQQIALDVVRAMAMSLAFETAFFLALTLPYVSLARAYGAPTRRDAPLRTMLYRAWLIPFGKLLLWTVTFFASADPGQSLVMLGWFAALVPLFVLLVTMRASARMSAGAGPLVSLVIVLVPFALLVATEALLNHVLAPYLPQTQASPEGAAPSAPARVPAATASP